MSEVAVALVIGGRRSLKSIGSSVTWKKEEKKNEELI
jgi:hypothetical protein